MTPTVSKNINREARKGLLWEQRYTYSIYVAGITALMYFILYFMGFVPIDIRYSPSVRSTVNQSTFTSNAISVNELEAAIPTNEQAKRITIDKIGVDTEVQNPVSTDQSVLNNYLSNGAVRYPTSGDPGSGNLFLFGHSSSLSNVINQAYKAFNNIGSLEKGDTIAVETFSGTYHYSVIDVEFQKDSSIFIPFDTGEDMLTLSTCNNFGAKEDRIVVRAEFTDYIPHTR